MAERITLTDAELAYISKLVNKAEGESKPHLSGFHLDGGTVANGLLLHLAAQAKLSLEAALGDYRLVFPLRLDEDDFHGLQLLLAPPIIYERGPAMRAWRLHLESPLPLRSHNGLPTDLSVHELSPHGLLVDTSHEPRAPKRLKLYMDLPGEHPLKIDAQRVRARDDGLTAYEVRYPCDTDAERIRAFLYKQHQRLHPHPNL